MPWTSTSVNFTVNFHWTYNTSLTPEQLVRSNNGLATMGRLTFRKPGPGAGTAQNYQFKSNKTYIWKTYVRNFNSASQSGYSLIPTFPKRALNITPPYKYGSTFSFRGAFYIESFTNYGVATNSNTLPYSTTNTSDNCLVFIDRPSNDTVTKDMVIYSATFSNFETSGIVESKLLEIDYLIQGYSFATASSPSSPTTDDRRYEGWRFDESDESFHYVHQSKSGVSQVRLPLSLAISQTGDLNSFAQSTGNGLTYTGVTHSNFISRYVSCEVFNLIVEVDIYGSSYIKVYLCDSEPPITTSPTIFDQFLSTSQKIGELTVSDSIVNFYNLTGEKYLVFTSEYKNTTTYYQNSINKIQIIEGYSDTDNNEQFLLTDSDQYFEPITLTPIGSSTYSTYSVIITTNNTYHEVGNEIFGPTGSTGSFGGFFTSQFGTVSNLSYQISKIGNGKFNSGVWENGVWNSGLRIDDAVYEFDNVELAIKLSTRNIVWRIQIVGSTFSTPYFEVGDRISISNIVAIDINEERKLLKNYYTVIAKTDTILVVETENNFPIRRIEKDSENHKILVTKNVWLNGGFLNGYFEGIWNDGLFRGYPYITEMYNSHWIDGTFNGGHFNSERQSYSFIDTYYYNGYVGLTFGATAHGFIPGDLIKIDKFDKTVNSSYDGIHTVTEIIDNYLLITDKTWETSTATESGIVYKQATTGLIQNFKFFDNNVANKTSQTSVNPKEIWKYNSWMDLVYKTQSSTNIGSNKILFNSQSNNIDEVIQQHKFGFGDYTAMNLYGYITEDVLSSVSQFRDIETFFKRNYSLGTKYQIYQDFLGDISEFNNSFDSNPELGNLNNFYADGWTYSFSGILATYSYLNKYVKSRTGVQNFTSYDYNGGSAYLSPTFSANSGVSIWGTVSFNSLQEDSFGLLLSEDVANQSFGVSVSGIYQISVSIPANFYTVAYAPGISSFLDNDRLFISGNYLLGELRLVKVANNNKAVVTLSKKIIKTSGGDYNTGIESYPEGQDYAEFQRNLTLNIDWKGQLEENDKIKVLFRGTETVIRNYNYAGPWRGSGFEQGPGFNDNITDAAARWRFGTASTLSINNQGVDESIGFNIKRTTNKTLQYESDKEISFFTLNNTNINIEKNRYSMIEFDIIQQPHSIINIFSYGSQSFDMQFHTIDLYNFTNFINEDGSYGLTHAYPAGYDPTVEPFQNYLSVYSNGIDYKYTGESTVREFFYNRPGLDLGFWNFNTQFTDNEIIKVHEVDNVKFYEIDMIPFFQYTTEDYINKQIQSPLVGVAPIIDYSDVNFNFIGNIQISLDGISLNQSALPSTTIFDSSSTLAPPTITS